MFSANDHDLMARAVRLATSGLYTADPNPRVGCIIVLENRIVGQGWHRCAGEAHAEIHALQEAGELARGATVYVTLEPCCHHGRTPPCTDALIKAGVARVIVAMIDPNPRVAGEGIERLRAAGIEVSHGLLTAQAEALNPGFISRHRRGRPYVRCKLAMSLDGRTALASGESQWITSEAARVDVHKLRGRSSVIVTGINTVLADDPRLNARLEFGIKQPDRLVLDSSLRMPRQAAMLSLPGVTMVATLSNDREKRALLSQQGVRFLDVGTSDSRISLVALLKELHDLEYNEVLVEAGPVLSGAFVHAGLVDELIIYMAPHLMGDNGQPLLRLPGIDSMQQRINLQLTQLRQVGNDLRLTYKFS